MPSPYYAGTRRTRTASRAPVAFESTTAIGPRPPSATTRFRRSRSGSAAGEHDVWAFHHQRLPQKKGTSEDRGSLEIAPFQFEEERLPEQDVKGLIRLTGRHLVVAIVRVAP